MAQLLQQLPCLTQGSTRRVLSDAGVTRLMRLFFHPVWMHDL